MDKDVEAQIIAILREMREEMRAARLELRALHEKVDRLLAAGGFPEAAPDRAPAPVRPLQGFPVTLRRPAPKPEDET